MTSEYENENSQKPESHAGKLTASSGGDPSSESGQPYQSAMPTTSRRDTAGSRKIVQPAKGAHGVSLSSIGQSRASKWQVSNSVVLPAHVTEREVNALARILKPGCSF